MSSRKNLIGFIKILIKWKWPIVIVTLIAAIGSIIVALILPNYYESVATVKPANLATQDRVILFSTESSDKVLNYFGDKHDINRVLSIANSAPLLDHVINYFDLAKHYDIDQDSRLWRYKTQREFKGNYKAIKTELETVHISVIDQDPQLAADIVSHIVKKVDEINSSLVVERNRQILRSLESSLERKQQTINSYTDSLASMGDTTRIDYKVLSRKLMQLISDFNKQGSLADQYEMTANSEFSSLFVLEEAQPADKKKKPVRWIIVVSATLLAFFLSLIAVVLIEQYRDIREELNND